MIFNTLLNPNQDYKSNIPALGALLAIDVGTKRIGIATCDSSRILTTPRVIINRQGNLKDFAKIADLIKEYNSVAIVVGYPIDMNDEQIPMSEFAQNFAQNLDKFLEEKFPIFLFEERLSSFEARNFGYSKISRKHKNKFIDDIAASIILQHFLETYLR